ncbi:hypothetical protein ACH5RR_027640 [Cinchona calisaya]|uniref:Aldehyde dehydrogenase domain-containing protein n=1 Tax=Cinchona calisaya TaxID=153742 RepID=A0ABD2YQG0_9GENT
MCSWEMLLTLRKLYSLLPRFNCCWKEINGKFCWDREKGIYDKFADAFSNAIWNMKVGDGFGEGVAQGPLMNEVAVEKVESLIQDAISKGGSIWTCCITFEV